MKKLLFLTAFLFGVCFFVNIVSAVTWHVSNEFNVGLNVPTELGNGDPIPPGDVLEYVILSATPQITDVKKVISTRDTNVKITLPKEGRFIFGIKVLRYTVAEDGTETLVAGSRVLWSDSPENGPEPWGVQFYFPVQMPTGFKVLE